MVAPEKTGATKSYKIIGLAWRRGTVFGTALTARCPDGAGQAGRPTIAL